MSISASEICSHWISAGLLETSFCDPLLRLVWFTLLLSAENGRGFVAKAVTVFCTNSLQDGLSTQALSLSESSKYA